MLRAPWVLMPFSLPAPTTMYAVDMEGETHTFSLLSLTESR